MDTTSARAAGPVDTQSAPKQQVPWTHNLLRTGRPTPAQEVQRTQHPRGEATKTRAGGPADSTSTRRRRRRSRETQHPRISSHDLTGRAQEVQWTQHPREQQVPRTHNLLPWGSQEHTLPKATPRREQVQWTHRRVQRTPSQVSRGGQGPQAQKLKAAAAWLASPLVN